MGMVWVACGGLERSKMIVDDSMPYLARVLPRDANLDIDFES